MQRALREPEHDRQHGEEQARIAELHEQAGGLDDELPERGFMRRAGQRLQAPAVQHGHKIDELRVPLQVHLIGHRAGEPGHILHPAGQPVLVLEHGDHDLGNAERGDGEIVRAQAERDPSDDEGGRGGEQPAREPGEQDGQAEAAEIAGLGRLHRLDRIHRRVEERPRAEQPGGQHRRQRRRTAAGRAAGRGRAPAPARPPPPG